MFRKISPIPRMPASTSGPRPFRRATLAGSLLSAVACTVLLFAPSAQLGAQNPATSVAVDAAANQHPINPNVYGVGGSVSTADVAALNAPLNRIGGDLTSTYNWQLDALNLSQDWYFESYLQTGPPIVPGASYDNTIQATYDAHVGSEPMVTLPMLPYIATVKSDATPSAASLWSYSVAKYGAQVGCGSLGASDPWQPDAGSGCLASGNDVVNNPLDAYVPNSLDIQKAFIQHLISKWGLSTTSTGIKYYVLDNEPSLWSSTHRDVHPAPETYDEEYNNIVAYASAIRALDPNAKIVGPEEWIWWAMWESGLDQKNGTGAGSDYATHGNTYYYPWLLQKLYAYQQSSGIKMLDVLTVHCYTDFSSDLNVETRELWDPDFVDPNWEGPNGINLNGGVLEWIPLMKKWVSQYYPGLEIGCTEYNWGNQNTMAGATAQADAEGIYGLYGFDLATIWTAPPKPTYLAMQMYRNYDGNLSTFGDTSVAATVANPDNLSAFAALRATDGTLTVMVINKQQGSTPVTVSLGNFATTGTAQAWQISSATQTSIASLGSVTISDNSIVTTVPSQSVTLFVIPAGNVTSKPTAPTGLAAAVGNGSVTLTWNATGGATSYSVQRGALSSGPFTAIGTVTSPAPTAYTDEGLTNGTTYYYVVSGSNNAGTGPDSAPISAVPLIPPAFTSSASASPNPVTQNSSTTITAKVQCTANTLSNGVVEIVALDPNNNVALTKTFTAQSFATGQAQTYTAVLTPSITGTYTLEVEVTSATGQQWSLNASAGTVTVNSALAFTSSASANPSTLPVGSPTTISATVKNTGSVAYTNGNVLVQIFAPGASSPIESQTYAAQNIAAGASQLYSFSWTPPVAATPGAYALDVGVFDSSWATDYYWNTDATITLEPASPPALTSPAPGSKLTGSSAMFTWTTGAGATSYQLRIGNTGTGSSNLYASGVLTGLTDNVTGLPTNGGELFVRLYYEVGSAWKPIDYTYVEAGTAVPPAMTSPTPGSILSGSSANFEWSAGSGVTAYQLRIGNTGAGSSNLYASGVITAASANVTGLPTIGARLNVRLYYEIDAVWHAIDYLYSESGTFAAPALTSPTPGSKLTGSSAAFSWTTGSEVTMYQLRIGNTGVGSSNLYASGAISGTTANVTGLPTNGGELFVRLYYESNNVWTPIDYTYVESGTATPPALTSPTPGTVLTGSSADFGWTSGAGITAYQLRIGTTGVGSQNLYASGVTALLEENVTGLPTTGATLYVRLYYEVAAVWHSIDYLYSEFGTPAPPALTAPTPGSTLTGSSATFSWTAGSENTEYQLRIGNTGVGSSNLFASGALLTTSANVTGLPTSGGELFVRLYYLTNNVWKPIDYTYVESGTAVAPVLNSPPPGSTLAGSTVEFGWTAGAGITAYQLRIGTTGVGSSNLYASGVISLLEELVAGLPTTGGKVYVRLYYEVAGVWKSADYTYTAASS